MVTNCCVAEHLAAKGNERAASSICPKILDSLLKI